MTGRNALAGMNFNPGTHTGQMDDSVFAGEKPRRDRSYEEKHPAFSYAILQEDEKRADVVQEALKSIAASMGDKTTVDDIARLFAGYSTEEYGDNLDLVPTHTGKPKLVLRKKSQGWEKPPVIELKPVRKKNKTQGKPSQKFLAYRWGKDIDAEIRKLAVPISTRPRRYQVSPGRVVIRLLELAIHDYVHQVFELNTQVREVEQKASTWSKR